MYSFWLVQTDGLFRSQAEIDNYTHTATDGTVTKIQPDAKVGDVKFIDANGDGKILSGLPTKTGGGGDAVYCGSPFPKYEYGLRLEGSWKFIDASLYLQGVSGNKIYNGFRVWTAGTQGVVNFSKDMLDSYSFNPNSDIPRLDKNDLNKNGMGGSDRWLEDGSYCRLKTAQIGFTLPDNLAKKLTISRCRIYIAADNLVTWTRYKGYNPDIGNMSNDPIRSDGTGGKSNAGIDQQLYPLAKTYHIGLQLNF
jgi:TonB-dependent starch-binding outer membrane protein SusC